MQFECAAGLYYDLRRWLGDRQVVFCLPRQILYQITDSGGMDDFISLAGKSELEPGFIARDNRRLLPTAL